MMFVYKGVGLENVCHKEYQCDRAVHDRSSDIYLRHKASLRSQLVIHFDRRWIGKRVCIFELRKPLRGMHVAISRSRI